MPLALLIMPHITAARLLLLALPLYLAIYFITVALRNRWDEHRTCDWPTTQATITTVTLVQIAAARGGTRTDITVNYTYTVPPTQRGFYKTSRSAPPSAEFLQMLQGSALTVRYNPLNHGESVVLQADRRI